MNTHHHQSGSSLPVTPQKRSSITASQLLAQFRASQSPSSGIGPRKSPAVLVNDFLDTPQRTAYIPVTPSSEIDRDDAVFRMRHLRPKKAVTYNVPNSPDTTSAASSSVSSAFLSPETPTTREESNFSEDEIIMVAPRERSFTSRFLRPRAVLTPSEKVLGHTHSRSKSRRSRESRSKQSKKILVSDTQKQASKQTARSRLRGEIASITRVKQDGFLLAHKEFFLPLLPEKNYIQKLEDSQSIGSMFPSFAPYRGLEEQPKGVTATMKPYQLSGLSFLVHLHENGMSGMLGDEMGLGKTLQTLSLFQHLKEHGHRKSSSDEFQPDLVICPLSVINSWVTEARKWTPQLKVMRFHGVANERQQLKKIVTGQTDRYGNTTGSSKRKRERHHASGKPLIDLDSETEEEGPYDLVITTYEVFAAEHKWFKSSFVWRYIVLDEGHKIKNNATQISTALQGLNAEYRLILTGTPLQNNLHEMWALLHWLYPHVFTKQTAELFSSSFDLTRGKVSTSVMDDARRLLELIMLRRLKNSPEVNLGLPPKEEVLLYVPLTPMQRFWYTRLLTRAGDGLLEDLFRDVKGKEKDTLRQEAEEEQTWAALDGIQSSEPTNEWTETKEIMRQALEQEQKDSSLNSAWRRLMNLVMQLRKCCSHPYLLPNAAPEPYHLGEHVIRASGKFIVLEKLLQDLIIKKRKKVLIFSGFTKMLACCEDLLALMGGDGTKFKYLRFDGGSGRARRNLSIRMFNDQASEYKAMLISTRAGGLGINLTAASDVIFLDEDWNPQITLQAEARAHRIGQTQPVTIYKLCTQGTVEEQMMGRIRKKLYLSAKITESMRNIHSARSSSVKKGKGNTTSTEDMPQLDTSQLKSLVRRGAQTLSHPEIDVTEMLSWDLATILEKCKDRPSDPHVSEQTASSNNPDEEKWLSVMERVECAVFDGKRYQRNLLNNDNVLPEGASKEDRRKGKNTTVMVDGFAINKESMLCADWEAVPTMAGKDPRLAEPKREKKVAVVSQEHCQLCFDGGELVCCHGCPRAYHYRCLPKEFQSLTKGWRHFYCPQHECVVDGKKTSDAGGLIFRCRWCPNGHCEDCLDWNNTTLVGENLPEYEALGFPAVEQAFYIVCPSCNEHQRENAEARAFFEEQAALFQAQHDSHDDGALAGDAGVVPATPTCHGGNTDRESRAESMTEAPTLSSSGVSTPKGGLKGALGSAKLKSSGASRVMPFGGVFSDSIKRKSDIVELDDIARPLKMPKCEVEVGDGYI